MADLLTWVLAACAVGVTMHATFWVVSVLEEDTAKRRLRVRELEEQEEAYDDRRNRDEAPPPVDGSKAKA